jgi:hypothetical protein
MLPRRVARYPPGMSGARSNIGRETRRAHQTLTDRLVRLERAAGLRGGSSGSRRSRLRPAIDEFLSESAPDLVAHLEQEARLVGPRVGLSLPHETGTLEAFEHEREDFAELLRLLGDSRGWLDRHEPGADVEAAAVVRDLAALWEQHVRRLETLAPILNRLEDRHGA